MGRTILGLNIRRTFLYASIYQKLGSQNERKNKMKHLNNKKCLQNAIWKEDTLQCSCGRKLAIRYMIDKEVRVFTYGKFGKYKQEILAREDTQKITRKSDLLGNLGNEEWEKILCDIRQRKANT